VRWASTKGAHVAIRVASFLCIAFAITAAIGGAPHIAGPLLMTGFGLVATGALLNLYLGFLEQRIYLGGREIKKPVQPALFRLLLFLNGFLALTIGIAAFFMIQVRMQ